MTGVPSAPSAVTGAPESAAAALRPLVDDAIALARRWAAASAAGQTKAEAATNNQLAALLSSPAGLDLAVRFVDRVARPDDSRVAAAELSRISPKDASFLGGIDTGLLRLGSTLAPLAPAFVVPLARKRLRQIVGHLVVDATEPALGRHLARAKADGFRLNVNLLGEAVLGEEEAASRTERVRQALARPDIDYVSIKVSSLVSQINPWDHEGTVQRCLERLRPLYRTAVGKVPHSFVNLDMEEYKDLDVTLELFTRLLSEPEFAGLEAGIVLQAYLPDALPALDRLIAFARDRRARGHAGIKVRLVKGANLAMEQVEAAVHGWEQAPYPSKAEVDANYLRCVERVLRGDAASPIDGMPPVRVGVASHNLFDIAAAHLLATRRGVTGSLDIEMLQGMAPAGARAIRDEVGSVLLYTPVVAPQDFDVAVSYLVRRLEENAQPQNFLHAMFSGSPGGLADQERRFRESIDLVDSVSVGPRRSPSRPAIGEVFANTPDSDPSLPQTRAWAAAALRVDPLTLSSPLLPDSSAVDQVVRTAVAAQPGWAARTGADRAAILRAAAAALESRRGALLAVMATEGGKTVAEADPEISEAVDFAAYYAQSAIELDAGPMSDGASFVPDRVVLVTPPWNFPLAIPIGGVLAALAAGAAVIIKPAPPTPGVVELAVTALHEAGVPREVLQVVRTDEGETGKALVAHPEVDTVVLTGATETAELFAGWRRNREPGPRVYGETSGKNALVITPSADLDLAVADLVKSAFGHAGQKCSAASLAIVVGSVAQSDRFRRQLVDAVSSLRVGWPHDIASVMGPVIAPPEGKLRRALTTLDPGERWLVQPRQLDESGRLWSPGVKDGVQPGSFFHLTEVFGPVLGLMTADTLQEAIALQNATAYGLTGGLHSLDEAEIAEWTAAVEVGNAYVNRQITGAIVRRQSFGGWKASSVGPGAKAGGPNYVAQLGHWQDAGLPSRLRPASGRAAALYAALATVGVDHAEHEWLRHAVRSDAHAVHTEFGRAHDESALVVESNVFRYRPVPLWVRAQAWTRPVELARLVLGAAAVGAEIMVSLTPAVAEDLSAASSDPGRAAAAMALRRHVGWVESDEAFVGRAAAGELGPRVRVTGDQREIAAALRAARAPHELTVLTGPVLANGRRELLSMLREQAVSRTMHRFGHLPPGIDQGA